MGMYTLPACNADTTGDRLDHVVAIEVLKGLEEFLKKKGLSSVRDLIGQMKQ